MTLDFLRFHIIIASFHLPCMRNFEFIHIYYKSLYYTSMIIIQRKFHIFVAENIRASACTYTKN
jgi:hypothetical protein